MYLGATDYKVNEQGIPVQLVGNTYLPQGGLSFIDKGKGWWEVWQHGKYVGYLKPGGKNGIFVVDGSPIVWPAPPTTPAPVPTPIKAVSTTPVPQAQKVPGMSPPVTVTTTPPPPLRTENIPITSGGSLFPLVSSGSTITEVSTPPPITDQPSNTAVDVEPTYASMSGWLLLLAAGGMFVYGTKGKNRRGRK